MYSKTLKEKHKFLLRSVILSLCVMLAATGWSGALYVLNDSDRFVAMLDGQTEVPDLTTRLVQVNDGSRGSDITLPAGCRVIVERDGIVYPEISRGERISTLLARIGAAPGMLDMVGINLQEDHVILTIAPEIICYEHVVDVQEYEVVYAPSADLPQGTERVAQSGANGETGQIYEQVWSHGQMVSRQLVETVDTPVANRVIEYGTDVESVSPEDDLVEVEKREDGSGILKFASGATMKFKEAKSMKATAYTAGYDGADTCTATGTFVRVGTVAVDKRVIPLGTQMYIVTADGIVYGMGTAEDTGVKGNTVDLYHETYEQCIQFGRRACTVYILE